MALTDASNKAGAAGQASNAAGVAIAARAGNSNAEQARGPAVRAATFTLSFARQISLIYPQERCAFARAVARAAAVARPGQRTRSRCPARAQVGVPAPKEPASKKRQLEYTTVTAPGESGARDVSYQTPVFNPASEAPGGLRVLAAGRGTIIDLHHHSDWTSQSTSSWHKVNIDRARLLTAQSCLLSNDRLHAEITKAALAERKEMTDAQRRAECEYAEQEREYREDGSACDGDAADDGVVLDAMSTPAQRRAAFHPSVGMLLITVTPNKVKASGTPHILDLPGGLGDMIATMVSATESHNQAQQRYYEEHGTVPLMRRDQGLASLFKRGSGLVRVSAEALLMSALARAMHSVVVPGAYTRLQTMLTSARGVDIVMEYVGEAGVRSHLPCP